MMMNEIYEKYCELDKRTYDLCRVLIHAEKQRQHILTQAMQSKADDISVMQSLAGKGSVTELHVHVIQNFGQYSSRSSHDMMKVLLIDNLKLKLLLPMFRLDIPLLLVHFKLSIKEHPMETSAREVSISSCLSREPSLFHVCRSN